MSRVLALVTDAYGGRGGIAQAARDILDAFAVNPHISSVEVLLRHAPDGVTGIPPKVNQLQAGSSKPAYVMRSFVSAARRPHIIFCNHLYLSPLAAVIARMTGAKLLLQLHGIEIWKTPSRLQRWALEAADLLLCVSRDTRRRTLSFANVAPERAIVVNNTVEEQFTPGNRRAARAKFGLGSEFAVLTVGRLAAQEQYKGHDRIIAALPRLRHAQGRSIIYLIAGEGNDRLRLERAARAAGVEDRVRFLGGVSSSELPDLYRAADFFALLSTGEGFGIAFIEAMACGTSAAGLAVGGAPDALADGELGTLLPDDAHVPEALTRAINAAPPDREHLAAQVSQRFGKDVFRSRIVQALELI